MCNALYLYHTQNNVFTIVKNKIILILPVTSPLNSKILSEAGVTAGAAAHATELRKYEADDVMCNDLGWICIPLVVESYGAWGKEALETFSMLASRLATSSSRPKSRVLSELYGRLNLHLVRAN